MIESFGVESFKSFKKATLPLAPLTLLIGANASGKSNAIEGFQLLCWLASGRRLSDLPSSLSDQEGEFRGGLGDLSYAGSEISLGCELDSDAFELPTLQFSVALGIGKEGLRIVREQLDYAYHTFPLYKVIGRDSSHGELLQVAYNNFTTGRKPRIICIDQQAVFTQIATPARFAAHHKEAQERIPAEASRLRLNLEKVLFLSPDPRWMRNYSSSLDIRLQRDARNISSVLNRLVEDGEKDRILGFVRSLPEQDIRDISFLTAPRNEVMVLVHETFGGKVAKREAALLSDGTLRVLAVAGALLSVSPESTVVIEEIDNGVHPNRAEVLLHNIWEIARERDLRVLLTTHNPAMLDALPLEAVPNVVACYRDPQEGDSRLVRLEELEMYPELVAQGSLGRLVTRGILDRYLKDPDFRDRAASVAKGLAWFEDFQRRVQSR